MKASLSLLAFTSALALAVPLNQKRDVVIVTSTTEVVETIYSTKTVWVHPTGGRSRHSSAPAQSSASSSANANAGGEFYERTAVAHPAPSASSSQAAAPAAESSSEAAPAPAVETPTPTPAAPSVEQAAQAAHPGRRVLL